MQTFAANATIDAADLHDQADHVFMLLLRQLNWRLDSRDRNVLVPGL